MKKRLLLLTLIIIGVLAITTSYFPKEPSIESQSAILMDASSGKVLYEKDIATPYPVASMSKMMTEYIVLDHIKQGLIRWEDAVVISQTSNNVISGAVILPVDVGDTLTIKDLFSAMVISSANNATIALAEKISGTEKEFTILMNEQANHMGLSDKTTFVNSTGLPNSEMGNQENEMTASDVATLAYHLISDFPEVLDTTSYQNYYVKSNDITIYTTNKMLLYENGESYFKYVDGLKTGYTDAAGYCFASTAVKKDKRLISVVIHANDENERFIETKKLLSFGFGYIYFPPIKEVFKMIINK